MSLQGKVALVTGGAQGIGRAMVESLLEEGASVSFCNRNKEVGEATEEELKEKYGNRCMFVQCDVTNDKEFEDCFKATLEKFRCLDILVNNAGTVDETESGWRKLISLNLVSVIHGTHLGLRYMSKESGGRGGVVVNITSFTPLQPFPAIPIYSATKAAINQFSLSMGSELYFGKSGVKVMALLPGVTRTPLLSKRGVVNEPENLMKHLETCHSQEASNVGRGLIDVLRKDENGSLWLVDNEQPPVPVNIKW